MPKCTTCKRNFPKQTLKKMFTGEGNANVCPSCALDICELVTEAQRYLKAGGIKW